MGLLFPVNTGINRISIVDDIAITPVPREYGD